jgi:DNA-binding MarR family transcriptional regulator
MLGDLLMTFYEVARQGSITTAARQLRVSQPTVTGRIRQLEDLYGVELFHRRASRVDLSDVGVALMPLAEQITQQESNADSCCAMPATSAWATCASAQPAPITSCAAWPRSGSVIRPSRSASRSATPGR